MRGAGGAMGKDAELATALGRFPSGSQQGTRLRLERGD